MKIVQVVPNIAREASGPSISVPALCRSLARLGHEVELHSLEPGPATWGAGSGVAHALHPRWPLLPRLGFSPSMVRGLKGAAQQADILHSHSLWMMPNVYPLAAIQGTDCKLVVAPRGTLGEGALRFNHTSKALFWRLLQGKVLARAHCLHATSPLECEDIRRIGLHGPVAIIPNGVDLPPFEPKTARPGLRRALFLSRLHPKKGLDLLLRAWSEVEATHPEWELHITGPDEGGHRQAMEELARALGLRRAVFNAPCFGAEKARAYRDADLFVLPTRSDNFGMVVVEALAEGTPCLVSRGAPWGGLETEGCGWWVDAEPTALAAGLRDAMEMPGDELRRMGERGRAWVAREFTWDSAGERMARTYTWLKGEAERPSWVVLD